MYVRTNHHEVLPSRIVGGLYQRQPQAGQ